MILGSTSFNHKGHYLGQSTYSTWPLHYDTVGAPLLLYKRKRPIMKRNIQIMPQKVFKFLLPRKGLYGILSAYR